MALEPNVGGRDRIARAVLGAALVAAAAGALVGGRPGVALATGVLGAGLLFNAATRFCGVNALLGVDTCSRK
ncbi:YgaP family membrane protein [Halorussus sp. AFM4]|uniref:YgaP family membrane protein n=1 Tax=Halorussus sp. AFM4 TaxID=3421651 RepID=UPI003EBBC8A3